MVAPFLPDDEKLAAVRDGLPAVGAGIYLDTPVAGPLPAETARAMADLATWELTTGRANRDRLDEAISRIDEGRAALAAILTADVDAVVLTHGLDAAVATAAAAIELRDGDEVVRVGSARSVPARGEPRRVAIPPDVAALVDALDAAMTGVRLVVCPHVDAMTGALLPIRDIAALVHARGAALIVDGSQAAGAIPVSVDALGADFYAVPASTWLLGPEGIGGVWAAEPHRDRLRAVGHGAGTLARRRESGPRTFEFHLPSVVGFARSCGWLSMYVGLEWIHRRSATLTAQAATRLRAIGGVEVVTPPDATATILAFRVRGWPADRLLEELGARVFAIASAFPRIDVVRIGTGFFNTEDEIERFAEAVALLAAHTPETVPPRRRLTVLGTS